MSSLRKQASDGLQAGAEFLLKRRFSEKETLVFGDLTRDYNPVHYDTGWSDEKGFDGLICHGLLVGSMICEFGGQVGWLASGMNFKFLRPVYFDDEIICRITLQEVRENGRAMAEGIFTNQDGVQIAWVELHGRLPVGNEKAYLNKMLESGDPSNKMLGKTYLQAEG